MRMPLLAHCSSNVGSVLPMASSPRARWGKAGHFPRRTRDDSKLRSPISMQSRMEWPQPVDQIGLPKIAGHDKGGGRLAVGPCIIALAAADFGKALLAIERQGRRIIGRDLEKQ